MSWSRAAALLALTGLLVLAVAGQSELSGPVLFEFGQSTHGVHLMDLVAAALWGVGVVATLKRR